MVNENKHRCQDTEVCGIPVSSRYGAFDELAEMLTFIKGLARECPECLENIKLVSCDSKIGQVNVELNRGPSSHEELHELGNFTEYLASFYYEETGTPRVISVQAGDESFVGTPDFDLPGEELSATPPGTVLH